MADVDSGMFPAAAPGVIPYESLSADLSLSWGFLAQVLRNTDESKVFGCKEDIDTLLVFAGLFSAVMTAFTIETYKALQPDPTSAVTCVLQTISAHLSNGTTGLSSRPACEIHGSNSTFQPSSNDIRINALWFASLVCSLIAASLGMLIKQWLREYFDCQYLSPQARSRIRQFRYEGLIKWKVFEIAALLPLLLQVALGLFFLGLCLFTESLNIALFWSNTPLIIAWITLWIFVILAPASSARCPYKTTLLKPPLIALRRYSRRWAGSFRTIFRSSLSRLPRASSPATVTNSASQSETLLTGALASPVYPEEQDALGSESCDINILLAVDSILCDDELLGTVMRKALSHFQLRGPMADILSFVIAAAQRRAHSTDWIIGSSPDDDRRYVDALTPHSRSALIDIASDALCYKLRPMFLPADGLTNQNGIQPDWMLHGLKMIVSLSEVIIKPSEGAAMVSYLLYDQEALKNVVLSRRPSLSPEESLLLLDIAKEKLNSSDGRSTLKLVRGILRWLGGWQPSEDATLCDIIEVVHLRLKPACLLTLSQISIEVMQPLLDQTDRRKMEMMRNPEPWMVEMLTYLVDSCDVSGNHHSVRALGEIGEFITRMLVHTPWSAAFVVKIFIRGPFYDWHTRFWLLGVFIKEKFRHTGSFSTNIVENLRRAISRVALHLDPVGLCVIVCNMASYFFISEHVQASYIHWHDIFDSVNTVLTPETEVTSEDRSFNAAHCLERIEHFDELIDTFNAGGSTQSSYIVPERLVSTLAHINEEPHKIAHLRRVQASRGVDRAPMSPNSTPDATAPEGPFNGTVMTSPPIESPALDHSGFLSEDYGGDRFMRSRTVNSPNFLDASQNDTWQYTTPSTFLSEPRGPSPHLPSLELSPALADGTSLLQALPPLPLLHSLPSLDRIPAVEIEDRLSFPAAVSIAHDISGLLDGTGSELLAATNSNPPPPFTQYGIEELGPGISPHFSMEDSLHHVVNRDELIHFDALLDGETREGSLYTLNLRLFTDEPIHPSSGASRPGGLDAETYFMPATQPQVSQMTIVYAEKPAWFTNLSPDPDTVDAASGTITVGMVLDAIRLMMRKQVIRTEWEQLSVSERQIAEDAYRTRCNHYTLHRTQELSKGVRRLDVLGDKCIFKGLFRWAPHERGLRTVYLRLSDETHRVVPWPSSVMEQPPPSRSNHHEMHNTMEVSIQTDPILPPSSTISLNLISSGDFN